MTISKTQFPQEMSKKGTYTKLDFTRGLLLENNIKINLVKFPGVSIMLSNIYIYIYILL